MSFELTNALAIFQKIINDSLRKYLNKFVMIYLNNILIYSKTLKKHVNHVKKILTCFIKKIRLKFEKCEFHKKKFNFLKFIIDNKEIKINFIKINSIKN